MGLTMYIKRRPKGMSAEEFAAESRRRLNESFWEWTKWWNRDVELAYWRKFWPLHYYIIEEFGDGMDLNNQDIYLSEENVRQILGVLNTTLKQIEFDEEHGYETSYESLSLTFGHHGDYDQWFKARVEKSAEKMRRILSAVNWNEDDVIYTALW